MSKLNFFQISDIFPTCFGCFLRANTTNQKIVELQKFYVTNSLQYSQSRDLYFCSLEWIIEIYIGCKLWFNKFTTWKMKFTPRSKYHHSPQVKNHCSRPRLAKIGLATPSLGVETVKCFVNVHLHCNVSKLKKVSKFSTLPPPLERFLSTTISRSVDV